MRKGGGKSKGGSFELTTAKIIAEAFKPFDIHPDDCYRTKNSGATKAQPGDLQFSPALAKLLPAVVECKHYRNIRYKLGRPLHAQPKSFPIVEWWKQLEREERDAGLDKFGLLIFRENNCPDLVAFNPGKLEDVWSRRHINLSLNRRHFPRIVSSFFDNRMVWIVPLEDFLSVYTLALQWFANVVATQTLLFKDTK